MLKQKVLLNQILIATKCSSMELSSIKDLNNLSNKIQKIILPGDVLFLYGEIGVGKTTFARQLIHNFEVKYKIENSEVLSPTFNLLFEYEIKNFFIMHYDFYRLKNKIEIKNLGIFENLDKNIILIEWPELIENKPNNRIELFFEYSKNMNKRIINIKGQGKWKDYEFEKE